MPKIGSVGGIYRHTENEAEVRDRGQEMTELVIN